MTFEDDNSRTVPSAKKKKMKEERKRKREHEAKQKQIADEEYDHELREHRYKSLMHLLDQSKFYANFIMKKIDDSVEQKLEGGKVRRGRKTANPNKNLKDSPQKNKKAANSKKPDLREYVSVDVRQRY